MAQKKYAIELIKMNSRAQIQHFQPSGADADKGSRTASASPSSELVCYAVGSDRDKNTYNVRYFNHPFTSLLPFY